jgi:hypothetical protein
MNPLSMAGWGSRSATSRLSFYIGLQLSSVLAPGIVVTIEILLLVGRFTTRRDTQALGSAVDAVSDIRGSGVLLVTLVGAAVGYIVGWISREIGFWTIGLVERIGSRMSSKSRSAKPPSSDEMQLARRPDEMSMKEWLRSTIGDDAVDDCIQHHPILSVLRKGNNAPPPMTPAGWHWNFSVPNQEYEVFLYCKLWLRRFAPELSVDRIEVDINILTSALVPLILLHTTLIAWSPDAVVVALVSTPLLLGLLTLLLRSVLIARKAERWDAVKHVIEDHMMRVALTAYPSPPVADPTQTTDG